MTAGPVKSDDTQASRRTWVRRAVAGAALIGCVLAAGIYLPTGDGPATGPTVGEKIAALVAERSNLQAHAGGEARTGLLRAFRIASLLSDALSVRSETDDEAPFDRLPMVRRRAFDELDALNAVLAEALAHPGEGARLAANKAAERAAVELDRLAGLDDAPLVLSFTPRFVPPRRAAGELTLPPNGSGAPPREAALRLDGPSGSGDRRPGSGASPPPGPSVPRYAPDFADSRDDDPPVAVEIVGIHLADGGSAPALSIGAWRGVAAVTPGRLRFTVPRTAFATDPAHALFVVATLAVRRPARTASFQLLFTVLPDRPGAFALDQRLQTTVPETKTLVSPEILARAPTGEARTVRRCFDPPPGWRFDQARKRVVSVERMGWLDDMSDATLNGGSVEFVPEEKPGQICIAVSARPVSDVARTATVGRFEATLVRDLPATQTVKSGIRALDWREPVRVPVEAGMVEWKLYVRLFDEIDREFATTPASTAFLRVGRDGQAFVLQADPTAEP